jgi:tRNA(Ile2) C34 agmatinyltransferase TiaS
MEKEEKVVVLLLFMTLLSLLTAYLCFGPELAGAGQASGGKVAQYTYESAAGARVSLEAEVLSKSFTHKGENLILQVDCDSEILSVFIPKTAGAETLNTDIQKGDLISLMGTVSEYQIMICACFLVIELKTEAFKEKKRHELYAKENSYFCCFSIKSK